MNTISRTLKRLRCTAKKHDILVERATLAVRVLGCGYLEHNAAIK